MIQDGSQRRFYIAVASLLTPLLNRKFGLGLDANEVELMVEVGLGYLFMSNAKEVVTARAKVKAKAAADKVVPGPETDAKFEELKKGVQE